MITLINLVLQRIVDPSSLVYIYLIATSVSALLFGMWPSIFASIMSLITYDFFFTLPRYSFTMKDPKEIINVLVFLFTAIIIGQLVKIVKRQNISLQLRLERVTLIEEMSKEFLTLPPLEQLVEGLASFFAGNHEHTGASCGRPLSMTSVILRSSMSRRSSMSPALFSLKKRRGDLQLWAKEQSGLWKLTKMIWPSLKWTFISWGNCRRGHGNVCRVFLTAFSRLNPRRRQFWYCGHPV
ncbi:MAG: DUF4118 domain-containing protein [Comamonadaceae bacterium]|nr:DUF4118 domain-containing protein [Comamonadaceae bacterium]